jgi:hypothetical protein
VSLADVAVACTLAPLWRAVLGPDARAAYPATTAWLQQTHAQPAFASVLGALQLCEAQGWVAPAKADKKKKKKGKGADGAGEDGAGSQQQQQQDQQRTESQELDPEKAAKKVGP